MTEERIKFKTITLAFWDWKEALHLRANKVYKQSILMRKNLNLKLTLEVLKFITVFSWIFIIFSKKSDLQIKLFRILSDRNLEADLSTFVRMRQARVRSQNSSVFASVRNRDEHSNTGEVGVRWGYGGGHLLYPLSYFWKKIFYEKKICNEMQP